MKAALFLFLALGASSTSACASFVFCHCYDSDGTPNNNATESVCNTYGVLAHVQNNTCEYGADTHYEECWMTGFNFDNCEWRKECQNAKATGDDSSCRCKGYGKQCRTGCTTDEDDEDDEDDEEQGGED